MKNTLFVYCSGRGDNQQSSLLMIIIQGNFVKKFCLTMPQCLDIMPVFTINTKKVTLIEFFSEKEI